MVVQDEFMTLMFSTSRLTPGDVLALEDEGLFELVDGTLTDKPMSALANENRWSRYRRVICACAPEKAG